MRDEKNYYEILGVSADATTEQIQSAYSLLKDGYAGEHNEIKVAYMCLNDEKKRKKYNNQLVMDLLYSNRINEIDLTLFLDSLDEFTIKKLLLEETNITIEEQKALYNRINDIKTKVQLYANLGPDFIVRFSDVSEAEKIKDEFLKMLKSIIIQCFNVSPNMSYYYSGYGDNGTDINLYKIKEVLEDLDRSFGGKKVGNLFLSELILKCSTLSPSEFSTKFGFFLNYLGSDEGAVVIDNNPVVKVFEAIESLETKRVRKYGTGYSRGLNGWFISKTSNIKENASRMLLNRLNNIDQYSDSEFCRFDLDYVELDISKIKEDLRALSLDESVELVNQVGSYERSSHSNGSELSYVAYLAKKKGHVFDEIDPKKWTFSEIAKPDKDVYMNEYSELLTYLIRIINDTDRNESYYGIIDDFINNIPQEYNELAIKLKNLLDNFDYRNGKLVNQLNDLKFNSTYLDCDLSADDIVTINSFDGGISSGVLFINKKTGEYLERKTPVHSKHTNLFVRFYPNDSESYRYYVNGMAISREDYEKKYSFWADNDEHTDELFLEAQVDCDRLKSRDTFKKR